MRPRIHHLLKHLFYLRFMRDKKYLPIRFADRVKRFHDLEALFLVLIVEHHSYHFSNLLKISKLALSNLEKANHFLPKSLRLAPMW